ncbi:hypothetical protein ACQ4PT_053784 [Festuca glaucescens]
MDRSNPIKKKTEAGARASSTASHGVRAGEDRVHRSSVARGTHEFQIAGYSARRRFARVSDSSVNDADPLIKSGAFQVGGYTWDLACTFYDNGYGHLKSITLELLGTDIAEDVVATASLRIDDPLDRLTAAVWRSDAANTFSKKVNSRCWKLPLPDAFCGYEDCYVSTDDRLTILCTVEVLKEDASATAAEPTKSFVSAVPPPTIARDIHKLLLLLKKNPESSDVTFVVEDTEILAHRLVLAMRSPVFAAELLGHMRESTTRRVQIHDMSASTFKAMLRFIYSDEFPVKPNNVVHVESRSRRSLKEEPTPRSRESMARDLLVAADRYDLERLRLMCESILVESIDITTVMPTLQLVRGRQSCLQLEDSCIEYIAADPDVYAAVRATEEYKELKETCSCLVIEINERVATHNMARHTSSPSPSSSSRQPPEKSMSMFNSSQVVRGTHEFRIPNFSYVQRSHGPGQFIASSIFKVGGYDWKIIVYPSGHLKEGPDLQNPEEYIFVYLHLETDPGTAGVKVSKRFRIDEPSGKFPPIIRRTDFSFTNARKTWGFPDFITVKSAKSRYMRHDGSLTIHCDIDMTKEAYTTSTTTSARPIIAVPPSNIASHLEQLMVTEQGSDLTFLVEESEIHAHRLIIAVRSPFLLEGVEPSTTLVRIDDMKATVLKAVIHFVYTDELPPVDDAVVAGEILAAACRFDMKRMKALCRNLVAQLVTTDNALSTLELAWRHQWKDLKLYCTEFISLAMK